MQLLLVSIYAATPVSIYAATPVSIYFSLLLAIYAATPVFYICSYTISHRMQHH